MTPEGVKQGLAALIQGGTPARFLILDDGYTDQPHIAHPNALVYTERYHKLSEPAHASTMGMLTGKHSQKQAGGYG